MKRVTIRARSAMRFMHISSKRWAQHVTRNSITRNGVIAVLQISNKNSFRLLA